MGQKANREWVFGFHAVESALRNAPGEVESLLVEKGRKDRRMRTLLDLADQAGIRPRWVGRRELEGRLPGGARHQGVAALYRAPQARDESDLADIVASASEPVLLLVLDGVTDPHNLGACLRTADAAGAAAVVVPKDRAAGLTPAVRKVASGAAEWLPLVQVTNLSRTLKDLQQQGVWVVGTAGDGDTDLYGLDLAREPVAMVMGAEGKGMRRLTRKSCDQMVSIPIIGRVESLNVSVAAGVCLYEIRRQRLMGRG